MTLTVREMSAAETGLIAEYFLNSTPEHLEMLGVDPSRLPSAAGWRERLPRECTLPIEQRNVVLVIWLSDGTRLGSRPRTRSSMASKPTCTCMSPIRNGGIAALAPNACGAASISISTG